VRSSVGEFELSIQDLLQHRMRDRLCEVDVPGYCQWLICNLELPQE
jgi:hypothetical protein